MPDFRRNAVSTERCVSIKDLLACQRETKLNTGILHHRLAFFSTEGVDRMQSTKLNIEQQTPSFSEPYTKEDVMLQVDEYSILQNVCVPRCVDTLSKFSAVIRGWNSIESYYSCTR
jgi:hypothetical protein